MRDACTTLRFAKLGPPVKVRSSQGLASQQLTQSVAGEKGRVLRREWRFCRKTRVAWARNAKRPAVLSGGAFRAENAWCGNAQAERTGFEPAEGFPLRRFSKPVL